MFQGVSSGNVPRIPKHVAFCNDCKKWVGVRLDWNAVGPDSEVWRMSVHKSPRCIGSRSVVHPNLVMVREVTT